MGLFRCLIPGEGVVNLDILGLAGLQCFLVRVTTPHFDELEIVGQSLAHNALTLC
jgi:hypothetical protein